MTAPDVEASQTKIRAEADRIIALGECSEAQARFPVNQPTISTWLDAMGYENDRFTQGEAPPSMAQVWTMPGLGRRRADGDPLHAIMETLTEAGFTAVLGTNCDQTYERTMKVGEQLRVTNALESVVGPKTTSMGTGYFVTSRNVWYVDHEDGASDDRSEVVATMLFRVLKFVPKVSTDSTDSTDEGSRS